MKTALRSSRRSTVSQRLKRNLPLDTLIVRSYTGAVETLTVPPGAKSMLVDISGAEGGRGNGSGLAAKGGRLQATIPVTAGEVLQVSVGQAGERSSTTFAFGGGGRGANSGTPTAGGGGGATDIRRKDAVLFNDEFLGPHNAAWDSSKWTTSVAGNGVIEQHLIGSATVGYLGTQTANTDKAQAVAKMPVLSSQKVLVKLRGDDDADGGDAYSLDVILKGSGNWWPDATVQGLPVSGILVRLKNGLAPALQYSVNSVWTNVGSVGDVLPSSTSAVTEVEIVLAGDQLSIRHKPSGDSWTTPVVTTIPAAAASIPAGVLQLASSGNGFGVGIDSVSVIDHVYGLPSRIVVAGGGGGAFNNTTIVVGGLGGGLIGQDGAYNGASAAKGLGGTQAAGGTGGTGGAYGNASSGALGQGGNGTGNAEKGGGGGGGYYGGGGGSGDTSGGQRGAGGGGSSYVVPAAVGVTHTQGYRAGNGYVNLTFSAIPVLPAEVLADAPFAYYRLDDAVGTVAPDSTGGGRHGTIEGGAVLNTVLQGAIKGLKLDGADDRVLLPSLTLTTPMAVEAWIKPENAAASGGIFGRFFSTSNAFRLVRDASNDTIFGQVAHGGSLYSSVFGTSVPDGSLAHVVLIYDGNQIRLLVNKTEYVADIADSSVSFSGITSIGHEAMENWWLKGDVAHVALYSGGIPTKARFDAHYDAGVAS